LKQIGSILLMTFLLMQALHLPLLSLWLEYQQEYIANNLCINRLEPELMCSGRCYINQQTKEAIGQQEQSDANRSISLFDSQNNLSPYLLPLIVLPTNIHAVTSLENAPEVQRYHHEYSAFVFQPPRRTA
jgi:hypothetical protein